MTRRINAAGRALIERFEGCELTAYRCPAGVLTVGFGSTGPHVKEGMTITRDQAEELLTRDLGRFEHGVEIMAPRCTDNQFAALVSFAFNLGLGSLQSSTLLRKHNAGDYRGAAEQFLRWNKSRVRGNLVVLPGLTKRRAAEAALYREAA